MYAFLFELAAHLHLDVTVLLADADPDQIYRQTGEPPLRPRATLRVVSLNELSQAVREDPEHRVREELFQLIRLDGHMPSGWGAKWCTDKLKLQMCHDFWVGSGRPSSLWLTGQRREESARRRKLPYSTAHNPHTGGATFRPALDLIHHDRDAHLMQPGVPLSAASEYLPRTACRPCVNGALSDYLALGLRHPRYLAEAAGLERAVGPSLHSRLHCAANAQAIITEAPSGLGRRRDPGLHPGPRGLAADL